MRGRTTLPRRISRRQREIERRSAARLGFRPNATAERLHDLLADRQADAVTFVVPPVQSLEDFEDALGVLHPESDPVVAHGKDVLLAVFDRRNVHLRRFLAAILEGIADQ